MDEFTNNPSKVKINEENPVKDIQWVLECFGFMAMKVNVKIVSKYSFFSISICVGRDQSLMGT